MMTLTEEEMAFEDVAYCLEEEGGEAAVASASEL